LQRLCDSDNETVNPLALRYVDLRQQLELAIPKLHLAGDSQFDGVKELVDLHFKGVNVDHYLEMAESEMKDVLMEPGGETDEQRTNAQIKAISMLQKLASTGTGKPLRVQLVDESRHLTTLIPMHPELHKLITDPNVPSDLLEAANDAIKETLKQLRGGEE